MKGTLEERFWAKVDRRGPNDCWIFTGKGRYSGDYGLLKFNSARLAAHRVSWEIANNMKIPDGQIILHICDNPPCVNPSHLKVGTRKQNAIDMVEKGRNSITVGEANPNSTIRLSDVLEIRRLMTLDMSCMEISRHLGIKYTTVWGVYNGKTWKHIT